MANTVNTQTTIQLVVGLGNIGTEYAQTRHNIGWWLIDQLAQAYKGSWHSSTKFHGDSADIQLQGQKVHLLKPSTYMNRSGISVVQLAHFYKILPSHILVLHDELDFTCDTAHVKLGGSPAGHNGIKSIDTHLGSQAYWRMRLGIDHPRRSPLPTIAAQSVADYVLHAPTQMQSEQLNALLQEMLRHLPSILLQPAVRKFKV